VHGLGRRRGDRPQLKQQIVGGLPALVGILRKTSRDGTDERMRYARNELVERRHIVFENCGDELCVALALERASSRQHLVGQQAEGKDVTADVGRRAMKLLGRDVVQRPHDPAFDREPRSFLAARLHDKRSSLRV
jgi:hypothetical protein